MTSCDELFVRHVDQSDLWWPPGAGGQRTHCQWVQNVTTALLQSGGVTDPMLVLLQPVCQTKVNDRNLLTTFVVCNHNCHIAVAGFPSACH